MARFKLYRCEGCPSSHGGWKRSQLRARKKKLYCPEHLLKYEQQTAPWPSCPSCKEPFVGPMYWFGTVESTEAECAECGFKGRALDYFDKYTVLAIAKPIERVRGHNEENVS